MAERNADSRTGEKGRRALKRYLHRYFKARTRTTILQERLASIVHRGGQSGALAEQVRRQQAQEEQIGLDTKAIIDLLPIDSAERLILELRHIDCKRWADVQEAAHYARTPCFNYYKQGLDTLLNIQAVQDVLAATEADSQK